jgi:glucose-6-phosphate isomerase
VNRAGAEAVARQIVGVSANTQAMIAFGISPALRLEFWEWVGGRYSLWSSVGFVLAIAIGAEHFEALLAGAHRMDLHSRDTPLEANLPVRLALLGVWNINLQKLPSATHRFCLTTRGSRVGRLFCSNSRMESNGKGVGPFGGTGRAPKPHRTSSASRATKRSIRSTNYCIEARRARHLDILINASASEATSGARRRASRGVRVRLARC